MNLPDYLPAALRGALAQRGYNNLTEVQSASTHPDVSDRDLIVSARTGSGKTVAFGLAIAPDLLGEDDTFLLCPPSPLALIVAPTRELALQVAQELRWLYEDTNARIATCVGGMDMRDERMALERGAHIVVGTPGRLSDHINRGSLDTACIRAVVLDEADEMLDLGFREELEHILSDMPETRRTLLFSATVPHAIANLARSYQKDALRITTQGETGQHTDIAYEALIVAPGDEENAIVNIIRHSDTQSAIVFCSTRVAVNHLVTRLGNRGFTIVALSGEFSQKERANALHALRSGRARVCIATDVAARGLDLPSLDLVIHADLPRDPSTLLHRSGRTGRAGRKGISALLVPPKSRRRVERLLQDAGIEALWRRPPSAAEVAARDDERLLADPALQSPAAESEAAMIERLVTAYPPEQLAAGFIRKVRAGRSAPEHLREVEDRPARKPRHEMPERRPARTQAERPEPPAHGRHKDSAPRAPRRNPAIENAVWIAVNVGRKKNADPKWLLPMLCKSAGIDRDQIGEIRVNSSNTHIELTREAAGMLFDVTGNGRLEGSLQASAMDGIPERETVRDDAPRSAGGARPREKTAGNGPARAPSRQQDDWRPERPGGRSDTAGGHRKGTGRPAGKPTARPAAPRTGKAPAQSADRLAKEGRPQRKPAPGAKTKKTAPGRSGARKTPRR